MESQKEPRQMEKIIGMHIIKTTKCQDIISTFKPPKIIATHRARARELNYTSKSRSHHQLYLEQETAHKSHPSEFDENVRLPPPPRTSPRSPSSYFQHHKPRQQLRQNDHCRSSCRPTRATSNQHRHRDSTLCCWNE